MLGRRASASLMRREDRSAARLLPTIAMTLVALTGCSTGSVNTVTPPASPRAPATAAAPPAAPRAGACYDLDVSAALRPTTAAPAVDCARRHTAVTVSVGTIDPLLDGHLVAIDSTRIQEQIARTCRQRVASYIGGSVETQRLSRLQAIWFSPSLAEADRGALWFRCDLVISASSSQFAPLPARTRGLLSRPGALNRYGTCGTTAPATSGFMLVTCSSPHRWRAQATIALPANARYLAPKVSQLASARCRAVEARVAPNALHLQWTFAWPTTAQWTEGQRYGLCWTPSRGTS
ncbi:MAG: hypothetical protein JWQ32_1476 [Marmoricola sp.]|nr:hypothetical protein [Marmoricola sp.]